MSIDDVFPMDILDTTTWVFMYKRGYREPRFPVPAIRQHFEWGQNLGTGEIILIHAKQGVYGD